jgi:GAF domain-containing protein
MMIEEPGGQAQVVRSRGYDRIEPGLTAAVMNLRFAVRDTLNLRQVVEAGRPLIIADTRNYAGWIETPQTAWVRSYLCGPLRIRDQVVGFFNLDSATPGFFTRAHADRLLAFTAQAAVALKRAPHEEIRRRPQDQSLLYEADSPSRFTGIHAVLETMTSNWCARPTPKSF